MRFSIILAASVMIFTSGCASIVNGVNQPVSVVAKSPSNTDVVGARCTLTNSKGEWYTTTPGSVVVHRAYGNMSVNCVHPTYVGVASVKSTTKPMAFGNIIFGGVIGAGIDVGTGSAYDYPDLISVSMSASDQSTPVSAPATNAAVPATTYAVQPVAVPASLASPGPALPPKTNAALSEGLKGGQDGFGAERLARTQSCSAEPRALMTGKGAGFETYSVACDNGDSLAIRCEFGNCRILR